MLERNSEERPLSTFPDESFKPTDSDAATLREVDILKKRDDALREAEALHASYNGPHTPAINVLARLVGDDAVHPLELVPGWNGEAFTEPDDWRKPAEPGALPSKIGDDPEMPDGTPEQSVLERMKALEGQLREQRGNAGHEPEESKDAA